MYLCAARIGSAAQRASMSWTPPMKVARALLTCCMEMESSISFSCQARAFSSLALAARVRNTMEPAFVSREASVCRCSTT